MWRGLSFEAGHGEAEETEACLRGLGGCVGLLGMAHLRLAHNPLPVELGRINDFVVGFCSDHGDAKLLDDLLDL